MLGRLHMWTEHQHSSQEDSAQQKKTQQKVFSATWTANPLASVILSSTAAGNDTKICPIKQSSRVAPVLLPSNLLLTLHISDLGSLQLKPHECSLHTGEVCTTVFYHPRCLFSLGLSSDSIPKYSECLLTFKSTVIRVCTRTPSYWNRNPKTHR